MNMTKEWILIIMLVLIANTSFSTDFKNVVFHYCYDGDTCTVTIPGVPGIFGKKISIRISGIDTPEIRGKCEEEKTLAKQAKKVINEYMKKAKEISIVDATRGKYFRIVADIIVDDRSIAELLMKSGLARLYEGKKRKSWCDKNKASNLGIIFIITYFLIAVVTWTLLFWLYAMKQKK
jgi:endonuclease YncB( thermonuclease family)